MANLITGGVLIALGYIIGRDGCRQLVVCPPGPDGQTPVLPDLTNGVSSHPISAPGGSGSILEYGDPIELAGKMEPRTASATYYCETLADARLAVNLVIIMDSACDQDVTAQCVGHERNAPREASGLVNIEASQTLAAGSTAVSRLSMGIDLQGTNWLPYIGVTITAGSTPPTTGSIRITGYVRRWVRRESGLAV